MEKINNEESKFIIINKFDEFNKELDEACILIDEHETSSFMGKKERF